jgi:tetratricopeptide (TPR) repeat protein
MTSGRMSRRRERQTRIARFALVALIATAVLSILVIATPTFAESPRSLVKKGNRSMEREELDAALEYYERASVEAPESPIVAFDKGLAYLKKEQYASAREHFEKAALGSDDLHLEAMAWYNMGNTAFGQARRQEDSDLEKALEHYQEAVGFYQTALEKDPELKDAAFNLEVTRLTIKDLLDRINKQREMMEQMQQQMKEVVDSLKSLAQREGRAAEESRELESSADRGTGWEKRMSDARGDQSGIQDDTDEVRGKLEGLFPPDQQPPPVKQALGAIDSSITNQAMAQGELSRNDPKAAAAEQDLAREQLEKAIESLTEQKDQQQQQQEGQQQAGQQEEQRDEEQQPEPQKQQTKEEKRDETAQAIIEEEQENKKRRQEAARRGYKKVDKDW